ncbi:hypothetical protein AB1207_06035 [Kineococcus endophyticus]|uniref:Secreted protein n=1 Tax=Kineococcus endophyticus TaxID=1181883 RepID=A0ABV3P4Y4_9ACTN
MAATRRRWAAAAGVVLAFLGAAPASAAPNARAHNTTAQVVGVATWSVVVVPGTSPATGPTAAVPFSVTVLTPAYLTLTNTGSVVPGSMTLTAGVDLDLLASLSICRVPWVLGNCTQVVPFSSTNPTYTAGGSTPPPSPGQTWYLKVSGLLATGVTLQALATAPAARSVNS